MSVGAEMMCVFGLMIGLIWTILTMLCYEQGNMKDRVLRIYVVGWILYAITFGPFVLRGYFEALLS